MKFICMQNMDLLQFAFVNTELVSRATGQGRGGERNLLPTGAAAALTQDPGCGPCVLAFWFKEGYVTARTSDRRQGEP